MTELIHANHMDSLEEGTYAIDVTVKGEIKLEGDDEEANYNTMALLELATCVETQQEPVDFPSTDAVLYPKTGLMVCLLCLEDMKPSLLGDHMANEHGYRKVQLKCHMCETTFGERSLLMIHKKDCRPQEKRRKRKSLHQIMKEIDSKNYTDDSTTSPCPICLLDIPRYCLKDHLKKEHVGPELSLTCEICQRQFKNKPTLREHIKLVHESVEETEECEVCGQRFRSQKYLSNHRRNVHPTDNKVHTCATCGKTFKSRLCLHQHSKHVHPPPSAAAACPHCPRKLFKARAHLYQHLRVAHGEGRGTGG